MNQPRAARAWTGKRPLPGWPTVVFGVGIALASILASGGCAPAAGRRGLDVTGPNVDRMVPVGQLAGQLGLQIARSSRYSASMTDAMNSLLVMGPPRPGIILNGRRIGNGSGIIAMDGQILLERRLAEQIRLHLHRAPIEAPRAWRPVAPARPLNALVALDAGHGGHDPGAPNRYGPSESVLVLDTVHRIRQVLARAGVRTVLTRSDDTFVELDRRAEIANRAKADLFVSIHADSHPKSTIDGFSLYVARQASASSKALAGQIIRTLKPLCGQCRGMRPQDFRVLVKTDMPAVLVELGYLTNRAEGSKLSTAAYRQHLAVAVADGIINHLRRR